MNRTLKGILLGVGITLGVLLVGSSVAYAVLARPPKLVRKVTVLEELLPGDPTSYVVAADLARLSKLYRSSKLGRRARRLGIEDDFARLGRVAHLQERTRGRLWDILGSRFVYAVYGYGEAKRTLIISQPRWNTRILWRAALASGTSKQAGAIPYSVFSDSTCIAFAGDYFWYASSEKLLLAALELASSESRTEVEGFPVKEEGRPLVYGLTRRYGRHLAFKELRWLLNEGERGLELTLDLDEPGGVVGEFIAGLEPPRDYTRIPPDAVFFVSLSGVNPYKAWKAASALATRRGESASEALLSARMERPIAAIATDLGDEVFLVMQGWDTDKWYAPARWVFSAKTTSERTLQSWRTLAPWLFSGALRDTSVTCGEASYELVDFGADLPCIAYLLHDGRLSIATDTALVSWMLDAWTQGSHIGADEQFKERCSAAGIEHPAVYLDWPRFLAELKPFLLYSADRTAGFTPADVESKLFPLLDAVELGALLVDTERHGETLRFVLRGVRN